MNSPDNPFKLPPEFPNIIKHLALLTNDRPPKQVIATVVCSETWGGPTFVVSRPTGRTWLIGTNGSPVELDGCLADRFCCYIHPWLRGLGIVYPGLRGEIKRFDTWLSAERARLEKEGEDVKLHERARALGYRLTKVKAKVKTK